MDEEYSLQRCQLCGPVLLPDPRAVPLETKAACEGRPRSVNRGRYPRGRRLSQRNRTHAHAERHAWLRWQGSRYVCPTHQRSCTPILAPAQATVHRTGRTVTKTNRITTPPTLFSPPTLTPSSPTTTVTP